VRSGEGDVFPRRSGSGHHTPAHLEARPSAIAGGAIYVGSNGVRAVAQFSQRPSEVRKRCSRARHGPGNEHPTTACGRHRP